MAAVPKVVRYLIIAIAIAICPTWPDLMGHAAVMAPAADVVGTALGSATVSVLSNAHFVLLAGMILGGLLLTAAPRIITDRFDITVAIAGIVGAVSIAAYTTAIPLVSGFSIIVSAVCFIVLYGATFYTLAGTAGYITIAVVSAVALALKAATMPVVEQLPVVAAKAFIIALPLVCAGFALLYRRLSNGVSELQEGALDYKSYGRRTNIFMASLIAVSSVVFAVARASSDKQFWGSANPTLQMSPTLVLVCTVIFLVMCYATFVSAPRDLMLRFLPCLVVQLVAYGLLWCGGLEEFGVTAGSVADETFCSYTELYSHMYFFMVMFVGLSMLGTQGVRVHGIQWIVFSAALFIILAIGWTEPTVERFIVVLLLNIGLGAMFLVGHGVYEQDQIRAIKAVSEKNAQATLGGRSGSTDGLRCPFDIAAEGSLEYGGAMAAMADRCDACGLRHGADESDADHTSALADGEFDAPVGTAPGLQTADATGGGPSAPRTLETALQDVSARYALSDREQEVLVLLVQGRTRQYIGEQLYLASGTVGSYISRIYEKMRVHSKQELLTIVYDEMTTEARV